MLTASKKVDYGILLMASLPEPGSQDFRSLQEIAGEKQLSAGFLGQVAMPLKKAGLLQSREGMHGGYQLSRKGSEISLIEIYEALEGPVALTSCQNVNKSCVCESSCPTRGVWDDLQSVISNYLQGKTLADFRTPSSLIHG